jgi:hypothetical protein
MRRVLVIMLAFGVLLGRILMIIRMIICTIKTLTVPSVVLGNIDYKVRLMYVLVVQPGLSISMTILTRATMIIIMIVKSVDLVHIKTVLAKVLAKIALQVQ